MVTHFDDVIVPTVGGQVEWCLLVAPDLMSPQLDLNPLQAEEVLQGFQVILLDGVPHVSPPVPAAAARPFGAAILVTGLRRGSLAVLLVIGEGPGTDVEHDLKY